jgi:hypothetical protein
MTPAKAFKTLSGLNQKLFSENLIHQIFTLLRSLILEPDLLSGFF